MENANGNFEGIETIVLGAGLVGSMLSIALARRGFEVTMFEKRADPRINVQDEGRSINLALSDRGLKTLANAGLQDKVVSQAIPMRGRMVHEKNGSTHLHPYGEEGKVIYSISRLDLNKLLIEEAECNNVTINFEHRCKKILLNKKLVELEAGPERELTQFHYKYLFGADGAFSKLRKEFMSHTGFNFQQEYISYGYKELTIPANNGLHVLEPNALHIWPRGEFMLIALPNLNGSFTCTLFLPFHGIVSFAALQTTSQMHQFFQQYFTDVAYLMPGLETDFFYKSASSMITIKCQPWVHRSEAALIGDAAHAILPFYGQGMNAGFEDVSILCESLDNGIGLKNALDNFNTYRKADTDAVAQLAQHNFIEMRDLVADPDFQLRKEIEQEIHRRYPAYASLYSMVTFSTKPYAQALASGKKQDEMFEEIIALENITNNWKTGDGWYQVEKILHKYALHQF